MHQAGAAHDDDGGVVGRQTLLKQRLVAVLIATGYHLDRTPAVPIKLEDVCRALGVDHVDVVDPVGDNDGYRALLQERLASNDATVIIVRRPCLMQMKKMAKMANSTEVKK